MYVCSQYRIHAMLCLILLTSVSFFLANEACLLSFFFFSSRRRHTRFDCDWSSDVCSSDLEADRVRLLRVDQHDLLGLQLVDHVGRVRPALHRVVRDDAEEARRGLAVPTFRDRKSVV